jgi:type IV pilus assembly protein PilB
MKNIGQLLLEKKIIDQHQLSEALELQKSKYGLLGEILVDLGFVAEDELINCLCEQLSAEHGPSFVYFLEGTEVVNAGDVISQEALSIIPPEKLIKYRAMPIKLDAEKNELFVAMLNPTDISAIDEMRFKSNKRIKPVLAKRTEIEYLWKKYFNVDAKAAYKTQLDLTQDLRITQGEAITEASIVKLVDNILSKAIVLGASDIHFDTYEDSVGVRFRIDGLLYNVLSIPADIYQKVIARVRVLSSMDLVDRREAQDGRVTFRTKNGNSYELRVSIVPTFNGRRMAIRLMDKTAFRFDILNLGFNKKVLEPLIKEISKPTGLVLVTGPTGSGKTTTLYSIINYMNDTSRSIVSIEDPVEFAFQGIGQVQVDDRSDFNFASALRSVLRQDPNVLMVGEIRDPETAEIAIRASLTGHLVLATMHTNDAATAITRLVNMGVKPFLIASSLNVSIAQRLVRKVCPECRVDESPNVRVLLKLGLKPNQIEALKCRKGKGCIQCNFTGFRGRLGIFEVMLISNRLREMIALNQTAEELRRQTRREKMISLSMDGLNKVNEGLTSVEEVLRQTQF